MSEVRLPISGAGIIIEPCPATRRDAIEAILDQYGWSELMPTPATPLEALGPAMTENYPSPGGKVRHTCFPYENSSPGKKIGRHDKAEHLVVEEKFCETVAIATLRLRYLPPDEGKRKPKAEWTGDIKLEPYEPDKEAAILQHMKHIRAYIPAGKLRQLIEDIVVRLGGERPFPGVPLLWLTPDVLPLFMPIKTAIEQASAATDHHGRDVDPTMIHVLSIKADEESARALINMLVRKVKDEAARVESRLSQELLTDEQAANDIKKALAVKAEMERYEDLLQTPLTGLKAKAEHLVVRIATRSLDKAAMSL